VLLYGAPKSPLAQPRNLIGGHVLSALVGVTVRLILPGPPWLVCALAVALAIAVMHATGTLHPPGGATALIAVTGGPKIVALGYLYVLFPVLSGALVMLLAAVLAVNAAPNRRYPEYWL
jgi:CBS-domain-containing membrane protein